MTTSEQAANGSAPVFIEFGRRTDEPGSLMQPGARASYPADVLERLEADAAQIISRYSIGEGEQRRQTARSALLPLLHLTQSVDGYISPAGIEFCAARVGLTAAEVSAVATFYSMYRRSPTGDYHVGVCTNTLCAVMGGDAILEALAEHLDIAPGETTADSTITLEHVECNAACDYAPVVMVNWEFFDNQTPQTARALVDALRSGEEITPTRGAPLCTFRETARVLAGFPDERPNVVAAAQPGDPTLAGLRVAREQADETNAEGH
jgi:NADH-quinone oxidoreductase subunit E